MAARRKRARRTTPKRADATTLPVGGYCDTCRWWDTRRETSRFRVPTGHGMCRAGGPNFAGPEVPEWPVTANDDWCGAFDRVSTWDETKRSDEVI